VAAACYSEAEIPLSRAGGVDMLVRNTDGIQPFCLRSDIVAFHKIVS